MIKIMLGDWVARLAELPDGLAHTVVTSPPYWRQRDYGIDGQLGQEKHVSDYVAALVSGFREVRRVMRHDATLWLNLGDTMVNKEKAGKDGLKQSDVAGVPWRVALALQADGWYLRSEIIWFKPNAMPESARNRPTRAHEQLFLLTKSPNYYYDAFAIREPNSPNSGRYGAYNGTVTASAQAAVGGRHGKTSAFTKKMTREEMTERYYRNGRNRRSVWQIPTRSLSADHYAAMPPDLARICIKAGTSEMGACGVCGAQWRWAGKVGQVHGVSDPSLWRPGCKCGAGIVPPIVLDPFGGAGTTLLVAARLARIAIGIELKMDYARLIRQRLIDESPMWANAEIC